MNQLPTEKNHFIPWQIIAVFILMSLVIGILGFYFYDNQKKQITVESQSNLAAIAGLKVREVVNWRKTRWEDGISIRDNPLVLQGMEQLLQGAASKDVQTKLLIWMRLKQRTHHYKNLVLLDKKKNIRLCTDNKDARLEELANRKFDEVMHSGKIFITDIHRDNKTNYVHLDMLVPIMAMQYPKRKPIGVLLLRIDPHEFLYPLIQSWPTPSPTAETLLVSRAGDKVVFLNELRHQKNTALVLRLPVTMQKLPAAQAVQGFEGVMEGLDYRNVPVLAAVKAIPGSPWHLVAKVDVEEVYAPIRASFWRTALLVGIIIVLGGAIVGFIWRNRQAGFYKELYTERKEAEAALLASQNEIRGLNADLERRVSERTMQLEAANRELEAFSYSVSHDLRAPLRSMDGFSQALLEDYADKLDETGKDYLMRVRSASQLMGELIDDLLRLSRITRVEVRYETVDLTEIVRTIARRLQESDPARQVQFVILEGIRAEGDAHLLAVALQNLLNNAWKFTGKTPRARIEFGTTAKEGKTVYFVRDNGVGFDMEYEDKLFNVFQRLHSSKEFPGTGVGLATVKRIMEKHGGQVWAEGEVGKGATVYFSFT